MTYISLRAPARRDFLEVKKMAIEASTSYKITLKLNGGTTEQGALKIVDWTFDTLETSSNPSSTNLLYFAESFSKLSKYKVITKEQATQKNIGNCYTTFSQRYKV